MEDIEVVDFENDNLNSDIQDSGETTYEPVGSGEHAEEIPSVDTDALTIESDETEEPISYEDYMELDFFTGESFPAVLSTTIVGGFGLFTICFLIGFGILKVISLFNINNEKGD